MGKSLTLPDTKPETTADTVSEPWRWYHILPLIAIASYMFTPILTWRLPIPGGIRWIGDIAVALMVVLAIVRMLTADRIPGLFLAIMALSIIGAIVASFENQHPIATLWGWWTLFRYPIVGLYIYLIPDWPKTWARLVPIVGLYLLLTQLFFSVLLFATGIRPGDFLAGSFGRHGTGSLILFILIVLSIGLGEWLVKGKWKILIASLFIGALLSILGEIKLFAIALPGLSILALLIYLMRRGKIRRVFYFIFFSVFLFWGFVTAYNIIIADYAGKPRLERFLEEEKLDNYLGDVQVRGSGAYQIGRGLAVQFALNAIDRDVTTSIFGLGIGTAQISDTFGYVGAGFDQTYYGVLEGGTSLMVMLLEMGYLGIIVILSLIIGTSIIFYRATKKYPDDELDVLRIGMIIYTVFWPLWLWYNSAWFLSGPAVIYWVLWGYCMHYSTGRHLEPSATYPVPTK